MTDEEKPRESVDLAREADFRLGGLLVRPSASRVVGPAGEQRVEPRVMEVLVVLSRHAGATVSRDQLIDACWGGRIVSDDAVNRAVAQARALARGVEPAPFIIETVPKIGFRLTTSEAGAPPDGEPTTKPPAGRLPAAWPIRRIAIAASGIVVAAAAAWAAWTWLKPSPALPDGRVEVMTFAAQGDDPVVAEIAAEVPETLIHVLAGSGVQVAPRPSRPDDGGGEAELRVGGTVERLGDEVVINTQVIDRQTGLVLLSGRYVRAARVAQESTSYVGAILAANLHCALEDRRREGKPISTEALSLLMNTCAAVFEGAGPFRMLSVSRRLVQAAPNFGNGHALHAIAAARAGQVAQPGSPEATALYREAKAAAEKALRLNPRAAKAYSGLALNEGVLSDNLRKKNWALQETYVLKALAIDPELPPARNEYAYFLRSTGRWREALNLHRAMGESGDARDARGDQRVPLILAAMGDLAGAEEQVHWLETNAGWRFVGLRQTIAFWWEDPRTGLEKLAQLQGPEGLDPETLACTQDYLRALVQRAGAPARGLPPSCRNVDQNWKLRMLGRQGDVDGAFAVLRQGDVPGGWLPFYYPEMRSVRADPRFWDLARDAGLVDYWRTSGKWPDFCAEPGLTYDCREMARAALSRQSRTVGR